MSTENTDQPKGRAVSVEDLAQDFKSVIVRMADDREPVAVTVNGRVEALIVPVERIEATSVNVEQIIAEHATRPRDRIATGRTIEEALKG